MSVIRLNGNFLMLFVIFSTPIISSAKTEVQALRELADLEVKTCQSYDSNFQENAEQQYQNWIRENLRHYRPSSVNSNGYFKKATATMSFTGSDNDMPKWIRTLLGDQMKSHYFHSSKGKIHYLKGGAGNKVLILFHGNPTWSMIYRKIIENLDPLEYTFIAPDLLNLGFSESLAKPGDETVDHGNRFNMENVASAMNEFVKAMDQRMKLTANPDVTLVVQDWGGPMGFATATKNPGIYKKIVILNTGVGIPAELPDFQRKAHNPRAADLQNWDVSKGLGQLTDIAGDIPFLGGLKDIAPPFVTRLGNVQANSESISGVVSRAYEFPARLSNNLDMSVHYARMVPAMTIPEDEEHFPFRDLSLNSAPQFNENSEFLRNFEGPVHVVWGVEDPVLGAELEKTVVGILPNASFTKLHAGHFLQEECPMEIAEIIENIQNN